MSIIQKYRFMLFDRRMSYVFYEICGCSQSDISANIGRSCFEPKGQVGVSRILKGAGFYHFAAAVKRTEFIQNTFFSVENSCSHGSIHFVSRKNKKITIQFLNIYFKMRNRLGAIDNDVGRRIGPGFCNDFVYRVDDSQSVRNLIYSDYFSFFV